MVTCLGASPATCPRQHSLAAPQTMLMTTADPGGSTHMALALFLQVTPSSKVVGDLAQFMVQNELTEETLVERADTLALPNRSVQRCKQQMSYL